MSTPTTPRPRRPGCPHSAQSWYVAEGATGKIFGCEDCDAETEPMLDRLTTLAQRTRRYRIWVAATKGESFRLHEFIRWVQQQWGLFAFELGIQSSSHTSPAGAVWLAVGIDEAQQAFDDWLEEKFGIASETAADPLVQS